jgi:hypothetical protein
MRTKPFYTAQMTLFVGLAGYFLLKSLMVTEFKDVCFYSVLCLMNCLGIQATWDSWTNTEFITGARERFNELFAIVAADIEKAKKD